MENEKLQIEFRNNLQSREWKSFLEKVTKILATEAKSVQLIKAAESLRFEKDLFTKTRKGLADGSITRTTEIPVEAVYSVLEKAFSELSLTKVIVAPANSMQFTFSIDHPPTPRQLCDLVTLDGDSVYVSSPDLLSGIGLDLYEGETTHEKCYELDLWLGHGPQTSNVGCHE